MASKLYMKKLGRVVIEERKCLQCGKEFTPRQNKVTICSNTCRKVRSEIDKDIEAGFSTGTIGAIHEVQVSLNLMRSGWEVFRALSPNSSCDLIAIKANRIIRVQVTKGRKYPSKNISYNPHAGEPFDILAVSFVDGDIMYIPPPE